MTRFRVATCTTLALLFVGAIAILPASPGISDAWAEPGEPPHLPAAFNREGPDAAATHSTLERPRSRERDLRGTIRGQVMPRREVHLRASIPERLRNVTVSEGDRVAAGQLLVIMDDRLQAVVVDAARRQAESTAAIERARLDLESAELDLDVVLRVFAQDAAIGEEVRKAELAVAQARVALVDAEEKHEIAMANLALEEQRLERHRLYAPFAGVIIEIDSHDGSVPVGEETIMTIAELETLEAHVNVPMELYGQLRIGSVYQLEAEAPVNATLSAALERISPILDTASHTFQCVFTIDNAELRLPAGFTVRVPWEDTPSEATVVAPEFAQPE